MLAAPEKAYKFCLNYDAGMCNWMLPADDEAGFCAACRHNRVIPDRSVPQHPGPYPDMLPHLETALGRLANLERGLIHQLFWDGRGEDDLARERGVTRQAVNKRKQKILAELRRQVEASADGDRAGFGPHFHPESGVLLVTQSALVLVGEKA